MRFNGDSGVVASNSVKTGVCSRGRMSYDNMLNDEVCTPYAGRRNHHGQSFTNEKIGLASSSRSDERAWCPSFGHRVGLPVHRFLARRLDLPWACGYDRVCASPSVPSPQCSLAY